MANKKVFAALGSFLLLAVILLFLPGIGLSGAETFQEGFDRGSRLYEQGRYQEALDKYLQAEKLGVHWKLFYNMGNCCYKLERFVEAKIYYLRAERLQPFEPAIQKNIAIVDKRFKDQIPAEKPDFIAALVKRFESLVSLDFVSVLLLLAIFALNLFVFLLLKKGKKRGLIYGVSFSLVIALLIFGYHAYRVDKQNLRDTAVIVKADAELRSGPGEDNTILFKVNPGLKVKIIDQSRTWVEVSASKEIAGWIKESHIERI